MFPPWLFTYCTLSGCTITSLCYCSVFRTLQGEIIAIRIQNLTPNLLFPFHFITYLFRCFIKLKFHCLIIILLSRNMVVLILYHLKHTLTAGGSIVVRIPQPFCADYIIYVKCILQKVISAISSVTLPQIIQFLRTIHVHFWGNVPFKFKWLNCTCKLVRKSS